MTKKRGGTGGIVGVRGKKAARAKRMIESRPLWQKPFRKKGKVLTKIETETDKKGGGEEGRKRQGHKEKTKKGRKDYQRSFSRVGNEGRRHLSQKKADED